MNSDKVPDDKTTTEYWDARARLFKNDLQMLVYQDVRGFPESQRIGESMLEIFAKPGMRMLDAGCGAGRFFPASQVHRLEYVGVDASLGMLEIARARYPEGDFRHIAWADLADADHDGKYDIVFECICLSSFVGSFQDFQYILSKMLKPDGVLIMLEATDISIVSRKNIFAREFHA